MILIIIWIIFEKEKFTVVLLNLTFKLIDCFDLYFSRRFRIKRSGAISNSSQSKDIFHRVIVCDQRIFQRILYLIINGMEEKELYYCP